MALQVLTTDSRSHSFISHFLFFKKHKKLLIVLIICKTKQNYLDLFIAPVHTVSFD